jgi:hypothetical protein
MWTGLDRLGFTKTLCSSQAQAKSRKLPVNLNRDTYPTNDVLNATIGNNPSKRWRAIHDGVEVLNQDLIKRIGDGKTTSICVPIYRKKMVLES